MASALERRERWHDHGGSAPRLWPGGGGAAGGPAQGGGQGWAGCAPPGALLERPHKLQTWFGVRALVTLAPSSYSRRILNEQVRAVAEGYTSPGEACSGCGCSQAGALPHLSVAHPGCMHT